MCDYSLELVGPARVGDKLISAGFPHTISRGFASVEDPKVAVCLLPGTELAFDEEVRCETGMGFSRRLGHKVARFLHIQKVANPGPFRAGVSWASPGEIMLPMSALNGACYRDHPENVGQALD